MTAHRRTPLQFCGQATAASSSDLGDDIERGTNEKFGTAFVHKLVSFDDERDVLVDTAMADGAIVADVANDIDDDDDDDDASAPRRRCRRRAGRPPAGPRTSCRPRPEDGPWSCAGVASYSSSSYSSSSYSSSLFGRRHFVNVEDEYIVDPRILGSGQHGSVRGCIKRSTGEGYAVKSMRKDDPSLDPRAIVREVELLRELNHESVIRLVGVYEDERYVHLITDLCVGGELFDRIVRRSSSHSSSSSSDPRDDAEDDVPCFGEDEAANVIRQILEGVSHMHDNGIVHRDIKPENVMFVTSHDDDDERRPSSSSSMMVKLIDLGLSRRHDVDVDAPMRSLVGTPYYIAPEVLRRAGYDRSCDLWSIGIVTYVLLCGYPPFNGIDDRGTYESILRGKYAFHPEDWRNIGPDAMDFVRGLLQVDPRRRMTARGALCHPWLARRAHRCAMDVVRD